jgi:hypothetical protein
MRPKPKGLRYLVVLGWKKNMGKNGRATRARSRFLDDDPLDVLVLVGRATRARSRFLPFDRLRVGMTARKAKATARTSNSNNQCGGPSLRSG